jgi:hypothetical protein
MCIPDLILAKVEFDATIGAKLGDIFQINGIWQVEELDMSTNNFELARLSIAEHREEIHRGEGVFTTRKADHNSVTGLEEIKFLTAFIKEESKLLEHGRSHRNFLCCDRNTFPSNYRRNANHRNRQWAQLFAV